MAVLVDEGLIQALAQLTQYTATKPHFFRRLFVDNLTITHSTNLAGKTTCTIPGYSDYDMSQLTSYPNPPNGDVSFYNPAPSSMTFTSNPGSETIFSWGVYDATSMTLVYGDMFSPPFVPPTVGMSLFLAFDTISLGPHA